MCISSIVPMMTLGKENPSLQIAFNFHASFVSINQKQCFSLSSFFMTLIFLMNTIQVFGRMFLKLVFLFPHDSSQVIIWGSNVTEVMFVVLHAPYREAQDGLSQVMLAEYCMKVMSAKFLYC